MALASSDLEVESIEETRDEEYKHEREVLDLGAMEEKSPLGWPGGNRY